ncbi:hypothetical protein L7F22_031368 [Adiantum nelumboides]|nr:hypothetical protein [Adiantum nelumboides]
MGHHHHDHHHGNHHGHHDQQYSHGYGYGYSVPPPPAPAGYYSPLPSPYAAPPPPLPYGYSADPYAMQPFQPYAAYPSPHHNPVYQHHDQLDHAMADHHRHNRNEHMAEVGAVTAGAFAMYEAHEAKVDPLHAQRHKLEAEVAGAAALGSAAYAFHEHREKKKDEHLIASFNGYQATGHGHGHGHHHHKQHPFG